MMVDMLVVSWIVGHLHVMLCFISMILLHRFRETGGRALTLSVLESMWEASPVGSRLDGACCLYFNKMWTLVETHVFVMYVFSE